MGIRPSRWWDWGTRLNFIQTDFLSSKICLTIFNHCGRLCTTWSRTSSRIAGWIDSKASSTRLKMLLTCRSPVLGEYWLRRRCVWLCLLGRHVPKKRNYLQHWCATWSWKEALCLNDSCIHPCTWKILKESEWICFLFGPVSNRQVQSYFHHHLHCLQIIPSPQLVFMRRRGDGWAVCKSSILQPCATGVAWTSTSSNCCLCADPLCWTTCDGGASKPAKDKKFAHTFHSVTRAWLQIGDPL